MDNTLEFIDQASFLGLRALGHGPGIQFTWIYRDGVDLEGLRRFHRNLGHGLLGRRIERSPLPFGRHRWIAWPGPEDIDIAPAPRRFAEIPAWTDEIVDLPLDPERGPSWRLAVLPLIEGGFAVTLVASHTVADGVGLAVAVTDAANGVVRDLGYPRAGSRAKGQARREDWRRFVRDLPEMGRAVAAAVSLARNNDLGRTGAAPGAGAVGGPSDERPVTLPSVTVDVDADLWDRRARELGGTATSLALGFSARLGGRLGWVSPDGSVTLSLPVNERVEDDTRGNALTAVRLTADPATVATDLSGLRSGLKAALSALGEARHELLAPLPLTPLIPKALARRLEGVVGGNAVIGCSAIGQLDPAVNRPDGTDADLFAIRMTENLTTGHLRRQGGSFFPVVSGRVNGAVFVSVSYCNAEGSTTREQLAAAVREVLDDFELAGTIR